MGWTLTAKLHNICISISCSLGSQSK